MANEILNSLLKEFEKKKLQAEISADKRKEILYKKVPKLAEIEEELNSFAINVAKSILRNDNYELEKNNLVGRGMYLQHTFFRPTTSLWLNLPHRNKRQSFERDIRSALAYR